MNIAIVVQRELNPLIGGIERISNDLAHKWMRMGHHVVTVCIRCENQMPFCSSIPHFFLPYPDDMTRSENVSFFSNVLMDNNISIILNQNALDLQFAEWIVSEARRLGVSVISALHHDVYHYSAVTASGFFVVEKLGWNLYAWMKEIALFIRFWGYRRRRLIGEAESVQRRIAALCDALVFLSSSSVKMASKWIEPGKLFYIPNGLDTSEDTLCYATAKKKRIICVSRLEYGQKRIDRFIRIWRVVEKLYPDWSAYIVGDGPYRSLYEKLATSLGCKRLFFEGFQAPEPFYREASILCMTSSSEGFGMVLVEAMRHGCVPLLFNSFPAASEIVDDGINGCLVKPFDKKAYATKLEMLMNNPRLLAKMSVAAVEKSRKYDIDIIATKWIDLFNHVLQKKA